jgi:hypothetical protein
MSFSFAIDTLAFVVVAAGPNVAAVSMQFVIAPEAFMHCAISADKHSSALSDLSSFAPRASVDIENFV